MTKQHFSFELKVTVKSRMKLRLGGPGLTVGSQYISLKLELARV
jgi:hypothetical protein